MLVCFITVIACNLRSYSFEHVAWLEIEGLQTPLAASLLYVDDKFNFSYFFCADTFKLKIYLIHPYQRTI